MLASLAAVAATSSLLLSSLALERISLPQQELFTELVCWITILLGGRIYLTYFNKSARPFTTTGLGVVAFSALLICLSSSIEKTIWYTAPLLSLVLMILGKDSPLLPQLGKAKASTPTSSLGRRRIVLICSFAAITSTLLSRVETSYRISLHLCWLFAQIVLYWGLFDRVPPTDGTPQDNLAEAFLTITELSHIMVFVTAPLTVLLWQGVPPTPEAGLISLFKTVRWVAIFILYHESKLSVPIWATIFAVCTNSNWAYPQGLIAPFTTASALIALYHVGTSFPQSSYARWMTIVFALFPIWAFGTQTRFVIPQAQKASNIITQSNISVHPIKQLVEQAQEKFEKTLFRQSKSLRETVAEYKKRYGRLPPPGFDKWYEWATKEGVQFIDEYDYLTKSLEPYWNVSPRILRDHVEQALELDSGGLNRFVIKNHTAYLHDQGFQHNQLVELIEPILPYLPDLVAALNGNDEPHVLIPHDQLNSKSRNDVERATWKTQPMYFADQDKQRTWESVTISCPPDSLARSPLLEPDTGNIWPQFVSDLSEAQNLCNHPSSFSQKHGFISSPSTFHYTHNAVPILATSKFSTFHDVMIPSSYYFQDDIAAYDESKDTPWEKKKDLLYWRGSGTGGHWTGGSWKMGHRQRFVNYTNFPDSDITLLKRSATQHWTAERLKMTAIKDKFKVEFSNFLQCDEQDCQEQEDFFGKAAWDSNGDANQFKVVYNLDGNSFSGRYYRFLKSNSLVFMQAMFKEWHDDRIIPWVHFVPISLSMEELPEATRYLLEDPEGKIIAKKIADDSKEWTRKTLRPVDLTAAYFRTFLEYARILDDNRDSATCC